MKRSHIGPRLPEPRGPVQYFSYGPWEFNVDRGLRLAGNTRKYQPVARWPSPEWIGPGIDIDPASVEAGDLNEPVIFATVVRHGRAFPLLIDGNHRVVKALRYQVPVLVITLDLEDSLKLLPARYAEPMRREGQGLGLLKGGRRS
jgi:hypothetical protein